MSDADFKNPFLELQEMADVFYKGYRRDDIAILPKGLTNDLPPMPVKCECGSEATFGDTPGHSSWCPKAATNE